MYLYRATGDPTLLELGRDAVESIEKISKVECGFATVSVSGPRELEVSPLASQKPGLAGVWQCWSISTRREWL